MSRARGPSPGSPWDDPLDRAALVFLDLEMTGLRVSRDRVIELCVERVSGGRLEHRMATLVRPECGTFGNQHVHGIEPDQLAAAPAFAELAPELLDLLQDGVLVAHGAAWDVSFLEAELARAGRARPRPHYLDTLGLSRRAFSLPKYGLSALVTELGLPCRPTHRAQDDVTALRALFERIVRELSPRTPRCLWNRGGGGVDPEVVEHAMRGAESGQPVSIRYRPAGKAAQELDFVVTSVTTSLDPPRVLGYLLPSRSRRELRADRILAISPKPSRAEDPPEAQ